MLFKKTAEIKAVLYSAKRGYFSHVVPSILEKIFAFVNYNIYVILLWSISRRAFEDLYEVIFVEIADVNETAGAPRKAYASP